MEEKTFTQTELNSIVSDRLNKEKEKYDKQIKELTDKIASYDSQIATFNTQIEEMAKKAATHDEELKAKDSTIHGYEINNLKLKVAHELGLPFEFANRLAGDTEEDIRKDAESIKGIINSTKPNIPLRSTEPSTGNALEDAYRELARSFENK